MNNKKIIAGAIGGLWVTAFLTDVVQAQTCINPPSCDALGYTMKISDCQGSPSLRCPLDINNDNAVFCAVRENSSGDDGETCSCPDRYLSTNVCTSVYDTIQDNCGNTCYRCWDSMMSAKRYRKCEVGSSGRYSPYEWYEFTCPVTGEVYKTREKVVSISFNTENECLESIKKVNDEAPSDDGYCNRNGEYSAWQIY